MKYFVSAIVALIGVFVTGCANQSQRTRSDSSTTPTTDDLSRKSEGMKVPNGTVATQYKEKIKHFCEEIKRLATAEKPAFYVAGTVSDNPDSVSWFVSKTKTERENVSGEPVVYASVWIRNRKISYVTWEEGMTSGIGRYRLNEYFFRNNGSLAALYYRGHSRAGEVGWNNKMFYDDKAQTLSKKGTYNKDHAPKVYRRSTSLPFYKLLQIEGHAP